MRIIVELSDDLLQKVQRYAHLHQFGVEEAISALLEKALTPEKTDRAIIDRSKPEPAVDPIRTIYHRSIRLVRDN